MKRFIVSVLCISVFFIGLGSLVDKASANLKSDEKALQIISAARNAIGGESAVASVRSMTIVGKTTHTLRINGVERTESGDTAIAMQLPNKFSRMMKIGAPSATGDTPVVEKDVVVIAGGTGESIRVPEAPAGDKDIKRVVVDIDGPAPAAAGSGEKIIVRKMSDKPETRVEGGSSADAEKHVIIRRSAHREAGMSKQNEMLRTTLSLLLSAPEGTDVSYTYAGESSVDGTNCNVIAAESAGSTIKLFIGKDSNLPVMVSYVGHDLPRIMHFQKEVPADGAKSGDRVIFRKEMEPAAFAEIQVKFSEYRSIAGVLLPHRWTKSVGGAVREVFDVTAYDINPANISEKFEAPNMKVRVHAKQN